MSLKSNIKKMIPDPLWRQLHFFYRLPVYYRMHLSESIIFAKRFDHGVIAINDDVANTLPDNSLANSIFRRMVFEKGNSTELNEFLRATRNCQSLVDLGASGGFFSAVFAQSRPNASILSVELDPVTLAILRQVRERNLAVGCDWTIDGRGVSDKTEEVEGLSVGYGAVLTDEDKKRYADHPQHHPYKVEITTLQKLCDSRNFKPDFIKCDIEGFEHEVITSSAEFLGDLKPGLSLELHVKGLRGRGIDPAESPSILERIGYKMRGKAGSLQNMLGMTDEAGCARAVLHVPLRGA